MHFSEMLCRSNALYLWSSITFMPSKRVIDTLS